MTFSTGPARAAPHGFSWTHMHRTMRQVMEAEKPAPKVKRTNITVRPLRGVEFEDVE